jgi:hypothetical protein
MKALAMKDKKNRELAKGLASIKDEVKMALLSKYLNKCKMKHALAFF